MRELSYRRPEIRQRGDSQWNLWRWNRKAEFRGVSDTQLKAYVSNRREWVVTGVYPSRSAAVKALKGATK